MNKLIIILIVGLFSFSCKGHVPLVYHNPILPGFHPDPSICRVGDDYYLVNSSFEWFPGLPVYHSKDLVNWELIGYGITRPDQVELPEGLGDSRGVYAPTIRYHDGVFYIINTCVKCGGNFYITAKNPAGPWSDPVWLNSKGIDPSLFWDDDGKCYYTGQGNINGVHEWPDQTGAWMQELDLNQGKLVGERKQLTYGYASNARWTEGPHLYKIDGKYLLLVAEGGTGFDHSVTIFNSDSLWGPYIPNHANPVMTHRNLGKDYPIHSVGHADLVQTQNGDWWAVMLGKRKFEGATLLARETFLTPVEMEVEEGQLTTVFNPGEGKLLEEQKRPELPWTPVAREGTKDEFDGDKLGLQWNFLRTPLEKWYLLSDGELSVRLRPEVVDSLVNPSLIARRIDSPRFEATLKMHFSTDKKNEEAGLILYRKSTNHFQLMKGKDCLILLKTDGGKRMELANVRCLKSDILIKVIAQGRDLTFLYGDDENNLKTIGEKQDLALLSDEKAGGFNGPYVGIYVTSKGQASKNKAIFRWFEYKNQ